MLLIEARGISTSHPLELASDIGCIHISAFEQNMEYKFVELMSLQYTRSPEDIVQHQITYRYNAMKVSHAQQYDKNMLSSKRRLFLIDQQARHGTSKPAISPCAQPTAPTA